MRRLALFLALLVFLSLPILAESEGAPADRLASLEEICLTAPAPGSFADRLAALEIALIGKPGQGLYPERLVALEGLVLASQGSNPGLFFTVNCLEWSFRHQVSGLPLESRLTELERSIRGSVAAGTLRARAAALAAEFWGPNGHPVSNMYLSAGTLVRIRLLSEISSRSSQAGEVFPCEIAETVFQDGLVALPAGSAGDVRLVTIEPPGNMGRDAHLTLTFTPIRALDGTLVSVSAGPASIEANKTRRLAMRVTAAGMIILGPAGILTSLFVHGKDTVLAAGTELYVQTISVTSLLTLSGEAD